MTLITNTMLLVNDLINDRMSFVILIEMRLNYMNYDRFISIIFIIIY